LVRLDKVLKDYLTTMDVAKKTALTQARIRQLILSGELPAKKIGNVWFVHTKDADLVKRKR